MAKGPVLDIQRFAEEIAQSFQGTIQEPQKMILGNPDTFEIEVALGESNHVSEYWVHEYTTSYLQTDSLELGGATELETSSLTTALLKPNVLPENLVVFGTPVLVREENGILNIVDLDGIAAAEYLYELRNRPQRSVDISQIDYALIRPTTPRSMKVLVTAAVYNLDGTLYYVATKETVDLGTLAGVSSLESDKAKAIQITINPASATPVGTSVSSEFTNNSDHSQVFSNYPSTVTSTVFNVGWVKVHGNMSEITIDDILPGQELFTKQDQAPDMAAIAASIVCSGGAVVVSSGEIVYV